MTTKSERLAVLSDAERFALYGLPDFDEVQRLEHFSLSEPELALVSSRPGLRSQVYCALQIGYFKAKNAFFQFDWDDVEDDIAFVLSRYFENRSLSSVRFLRTSVSRSGPPFWSCSAIGHGRRSSSEKSS